MRSKFPGYYRPTENEFKDIWENSIVVLDTNVLLDLFRYSDDTVNALIDSITTLDKRIWIPYRVSLEYHRNLNDVITTQINSYHKTIKTLEEFKGQLDAKRSHPFLDKKLHDEIRSFCQKFDGELLKKKDEVERLITDNPIKEKISQLLDNKVGDAFSDTQIQQICNDGSKRYTDKCPPGYKDSKTKQGTDIYGDLIIWNEIIEKAKKDSTHIILVTGDVKEDWFLIHSGKTLGPRPELIHEFRDKTKKMFYAYSTDQFLEYSNIYFKSNIGKDVIEEVKNVIVTELGIGQTYSTSGTMTYSSGNSATELPNTGELINNTSSISQPIISKTGQTEQTK